MHTRSQQETFGRYISYLLRHCPRAANLDIDKHGWVSSSALVEAVQSEYPDVPFGMDTLRDIVENDNKQRYSFSDDESYIRANQGHSFPVDLGLSSITPPNILYHGTSTRFVDSIFDNGILPQSRTHVHLSSDMDTAMEVGARHGCPCVLRIHADDMHADGYEFFLSENGVWLTSIVPSEYIEQTIAK